MGLIQRIRESFQRDAVLARMIPLWKQGQKLHGPHDFEEFAKEAIRGNPIVYACVDELCTSVSEAPLLAERRTRLDEWAPLDDVQAILDHPNRDMTQLEWLHEWMMNVMWAGINFEQVVRSDMGLAREFWALKPHRTKIVPGYDGRISHLTYTVGGVEQAPIPVEDVVIDRSPDPLDDYWGLSPVHVASLCIDLDNEAMKYLTDFFLNAGQPAHVLKLKERVERAERERVKARWREEYGRGGFHGLAVLDADADLQELGSRPDKLGLEDIFDATEARICGVFGVHPAIIATRLGLKRSTLTNFPEARRNFQLRTVEQYRRRIESRLTVFWQRELVRKDIRIRFDRSVVQDLQEDMGPQREFAVTAWKEGLVTLNEARELAGLKPVEGEEGDEYKSASQSPSDAGDEDDDGDDAAPDDGGQEEERRAIPVAMNGSSRERPPVASPNGHARERLLGVAVLERQAETEVALSTGDSLERYARAVDETAASWEERFTNEAERLFDSERQAVQRALRDQLSRHQNDDLAHRILLVIGEALNEHREVWAQGMMPLFSGLLEDQAQHWAAQFGMSFSLDNPEVQRFLQRYSFRFAERLGKTSEEALRGIVTDGIQEGKSATAIRRDIAAAYEAFGPNRADMIARSESIRASNKGALESYRLAGIQRMQWLATPDGRTCPYCGSLDGREFAVGGTILGVGETLNVDGAPPLTNTYEDVDAPPIHVRCRCTIIPIMED